MPIRQTVLGWTGIGTGVRVSVSKARAESGRQGIGVDVAQRGQGMPVVAIGNRPSFLETASAAEIPAFQATAGDRPRHANDHRDPRRLRPRDRPEPLGNFRRTLALPDAEQWSLTTLKDKIIKIGAKVVRHGRYVAFQMAEVAIPRAVFADIPRLIALLRPLAGPAPA